MPLLACYTRYAALQAREYFIYEYYASRYARGVTVDKDFSVSCLHYSMQKNLLTVVVVKLVLAVCLLLDVAILTSPPIMTLASEKIAPF